MFTPDISDLTDEERAAYWQGAYERMRDRNIELAAENDSLKADRAVPHRSYREA